MPVTGRPPDASETFRERVEREAARAGAALDMPFVLRAFDFMAAAHAEQLRKSGEPFMLHPVETASIVLDLLGARTDSVALAASLLHDVCEDTAVGAERIRDEFGPDVAALVEGVTKISGLSFDSPVAEQAENFRKMLLSMARDIRVILIKLCDRLHNMRTLEPLDPEQRERISRETLEIYAPLAHRLGIGKIRWELEDLALKWLMPSVYFDLAGKVASRRAERLAIIEEMERPILERLKTVGIPVEVSGRVKNFYSIHRKMQSRGLPIEEIYDLFGVRIITRSVADCYQMLGIVHDLFVPVQERFKDYIALPKTNLYQSLHTTVIGPRQKMVEVQIRTREMHRTAELGIAAHYSYKEGGRPDHELADRLDSLLTQTSEWQAETSDAREFMDLLRVSLYQDEVFVFTPKRDLRRLPKGSTPIDFAYMIHSEVGDRCVGARVNGRIVPLRHHLRNGDVVEIQTSPSGRPSEAWLKIVRTPRAKAKVRHYLRERRLEDAAALGREMIDRECRRNREKVPVEKDLLEAAQGLGLEDVKHLLAAVGRGDMSALHVFHRLFPSREPSRPSPLATVGKLRDLAFRAGRGLRIQNVDNLMIQMARCCSPVPGEKVVGIITRGRGISVHRASCPNTSDPALEPERRIALQWDVDATRAFLVKLVVHGREREGLLADIAQAITDMKTNIRRAGVASRAASARGVFIIEVRDLQHLRSVIAAMKKVKGVTRIDRYHQISGGERAEG